MPTKHRPQVFTLIAMRRAVAVAREMGVDFIIDPNTGAFKFLTSKDPGKVKMIDGRRIAEVYPPWQSQASAAS
jgi:hypothetical protein